MLLNFEVKKGIANPQITILFSSTQSHPMKNQKSYFLQTHLKLVNLHIVMDNEIL